MPFLKIDNVDINYVTGEKGIMKGKKNLIFIHGAGGNSKIWEFQLHYFKDEYNPILIELPGHGESKGNGEKDIGSYIQWMKKIIECLDLKTCFMIGHSMGGAITLSFALKYPEYLDAVILVGTGVRLKVRQVILDSIKEDFEGSVKLMSTFLYSEHTPAKYIEMGEEELLKTRPEILYGDFSACNTFDILNEIKKIKLPALITCGAEDKLTPVKYSRFLNENINRSKLVIIEDAGHMVMIEKSKEFNTEVQDFVSALPASH
ncbi:MAG: alpha/beta hydrolase [Thermodesulfobacteriota bacterium]|nr:alpha/beta hydrolase [Thermodesulfobacteriota bacterium]